MSFTPLKIPGSWVFTPKRFSDERGSFHEVFHLPLISEVLGFGFEVKQVNQSVSAAGVIRGIHWADVPPGQAKYVFCPRGAIWDVVVDIRVGSPTFGQFAGEELSSENGKCLLIQEGLGHVFLSLKNDSVVNYLCSEPYNPSSENEINPLDPDLGIPFETMWHTTGYKLSSKDRDAHSLQEMQKQGKLPSFI